MVAVIVIALVADQHELASEAQTLTKLSPRDHVLNVIRAGVNGIPFVGGAMASLMADYIPTTAGKRLEQFAKDLVEEMQRVAGELDVNYVKTEEFAYLFQKAFENASRDYQKEKLEAYRNILVNSLRLDADASLTESYMRRVEGLTPIHLKMLWTVFGGAVELRQHDPHRGAEDRDWSEVTLPWNSVLALYADDELRRLNDQLSAFAQDLDSQGITISFAQALLWVPHSKSEAEMGGQGKTSYTTVTAYGRGFLRFISAPRGLTEEQR